MLSIRMQRLGRKGHPMYRVVVQDSRQSPDSGKYVALLGSYDPHNKTVNLTKDKAEFYLKNGAQPSDRVAKLFKSEKIALPSWVKEPTKQERKTRNAEKLRKNRPADAPAPEAPAEQAEGEVAEPAVEEAAPAAPAPESEAEQTAEATEPEVTAEDAQDGSAETPEQAEAEKPAENEKTAQEPEQTAENNESESDPKEQKA